MSSIMLIRGESCLLSAALAVALVASAAFGQTPASSPGGLENEVAEIKAENAVLRDQLRRVEEQQKLLVELVGELRQRLGPAMTATAKTPQEVGSEATPTVATLQPLSPTVSV